MDCAICGSNCEHPDEPQWHWTQKELDQAEIDAKEIGKLFIYPFDPKQDYLDGKVSGMRLAQKLGTTFSDLKPILDKWRRQEEREYHEGLDLVE